MKARELILNTKDDRREIVTLLLKLSPVERRSFMRWCCDQATGPKPSPAKGDIPNVKACYRDDDADWRYTLSLFYDFWTLVMQYGCDSVKMSLELERRVRRR